MEKYKEALEKLKIAVNGGREIWEQWGTLPSEYVNNIVHSALEDVLKYLIEKRHKVEEPENKIVIHYTSIAALMSMLQDASTLVSIPQDASNKKKNQEDKKLKPSYLRLYDSVHLNDPDEGSYFSRNLNLPQKYNWLEKKDVRHAYIASFILPNSKNDMSDNLIFWRTYGQEGEGCALSLSVPYSRLHEVRYGNKEVESTAETLIPILDLLDPLLEINDSLIKKILSEVVWESLERIRYLYKSEGL